MSSSEMSYGYGDKMRRVQAIVSALQSCDDVDQMVTLYSEGNNLLLQCKARLEETKGVCTTITETKF